jgi:hypothetical protein
MFPGLATFGNYVQKPIFPALPTSVKRAWLGDNVPLFDHLCMGNTVCDLCNSIIPSLHI